MMVNNGGGYNDAWWSGGGEQSVCSHLNGINRILPILGVGQC